MDATKKVFHFGVSTTHLHNIAIPAANLDEAVLLFDDMIHTGLMDGKHEGFAPELFQTDMNIIGVGVMEDGKMASAGTITDETDEILTQRKAGRDLAEAANDSTAR